MAGLSVRGKRMDVTWSALLSCSKPRNVRPPGQAQEAGSPTRCLVVTSPTFVPRSVPVSFCGGLLRMTAVCLLFTWYCSFVTCAAQQVLDITREMVSHARSHVDDVEFSAEDALRSDYEFLSEVNYIIFSHGIILPPLQCGTYIVKNLFLMLVLKICRSIVSFVWWDGTTLAWNLSAVAARSRG